MNARKAAAENTDTTVKQEYHNTGTLVTPKEEEVKETKPLSRPRVKRPLSALNVDPIPPVAEPQPESQQKPKQEKVEPIIEPQPKAVEQSKKTRRSAKMDEADFGTLAAAFIFPTDLAEKKPLFFPERIRESLRKVAGLIPGGKVSPSHVAIHIVNAWLDKHRDLLNRVLASQKTSI